MDLSKFYEQERLTLRKELEVLRNQQITFLTTSIAATGLLLSVASALGSKPDVGVAFIFPLIILLPSWWIFFDKATVIARIVGYYRILERLILKHCEVTNITGWENAIGELRKGITHREVDFPKRDKGFLFSQLIEMLLLRTGHRYWVLCYYIFLTLSGSCLAVSWFLILSVSSLVVKPSSYFVMLVSTVLFLISAVSNMLIMWQLIYGRQSYDYYEHCWAQVLGIKQTGKSR